MEDHGAEADRDEQRAGVEVERVTGTQQLRVRARVGREIAEVLGISESNVGTKLTRLKERLRKTLATV